MEKEPPVNVEPGMVVKHEFTDAIGHHKSTLKVDRVDEDGVYQDTITGERFLAWLCFTKGDWEVDR